jgi:hypothetical protein
MKYKAAGIEYDTNKWRCDNCETVFFFGDGAWDIDNHCPICGNDDPDKILEPIYDIDNRKGVWDINITCLIDALKETLKANEQIINVIEKMKVFNLGETK